MIIGIGATEQVNRGNARIEKTDVIAAGDGHLGKSRIDADGEANPLGHKRPLVGTVGGENL